MRALATEICGSRPDAEAVTASTGTSASFASPFSLRYSMARCLTRARNVGLVGPKLEPELMSWVRSLGSFGTVLFAFLGSAASVPAAAAPAALGRPWKYFAFVNV